MATPVAKVLTGVHPGCTGTVVVVVGGCAATAGTRPGRRFGLAWPAVGDGVHPASMISQSDGDRPPSAPRPSIPPMGSALTRSGNGHLRPTAT